jgi:endonuclease/exonuclease/phosphatase (EEP) superfamily protein YafD
VKPFLRRMAADGAVFAVAAVIAALVVRLTVRDRVPGLDVLYYATPPVVSGVVAIVAGAILWRTERRRVAAGAAALAAVCCALYLHGSFVGNAEASPGALRGLFWNVEHGSAGWTTLAADVARFDPDVAWLAEAGDGTHGEDDAFRAALPDRTLLRIRGGLVVIVRGEAKLVERQRLPNAGRAAVVEIAVKDRALTTVFADLGSNPSPRSPPLGRVWRMAEPRLGAPLFVLGDFNTPRDSAVFDAWRPHLKHAFESAGHGLDATWPQPCPVLAIDHVWAGGGAVVRTCELPYTWHSDHRPVVFTFDVR